MKTHPSALISTNHHSLRNDLRYTPPSPDYNRFAHLAANQDIGFIPKKKLYDYGYVGNYESFSSDAGNSSSSEEDVPLAPLYPPSFKGLVKRNAVRLAPSTPLNLRASSKQIPTPKLRRVTASTKSFFDHQYPELNAPQAKKSDFNIYSSDIESEGSSSDDYSDSPGLFGAW